VINNRERIGCLRESDYQELFGVKKPTFDLMIERLTKAQAQKHVKGGRNSKLTVLDMLMIFLAYLHDYRTMKALAFDYGVAKSTIHSTIIWVENTLINCSEFTLPSRRILKEGTSIEVVLVDVTEQQVERPKKSKDTGTLAKRKNTP
jgi:hypothetical protein